ncbi:TonB-dependent siderophore receptor [Alcanivorax xiamenensis]|uniref:TonB-dependent siderophore receptor n=1 Tax=Alcanivorax xiamenensis TaxID=1177156 RepID=UPI0019162D62|nr:TonB-dependent siderophore receptor [Alcanivorax xiamenensis]
MAKPYHPAHPRRRPYLLCTSLTSVLMLPTALHADTSGPHQLETVDVAGDTTSRDLGTGVTTLSKFPLSPREIPQSASVIERQRIEQQNLYSLDEVLEQATGITVQPFQNLTTQYYARGFQVDGFELDGVPVAIGGQASSPQDMSIYQRVEILRGANGLLHGAGNPAATLNLVRKKPTRKGQANILLSTGRWDRHRGELDLSGPLNEAGTLRGRLVTAREERDFFYDVADQNTNVFHGVLEADLGARTVLTTGVQYQTIDSTTNMAGVPFARDGSDLKLSRSRYFDVDWDQFDWTTRRFFAAVEHRLAGDWIAKLNGEYEDTQSKLKYAGVYGYAIDPETGDGAMLSPGAYKFDTQSHSADISLQGPFHWLGRQHEAVLGLSYARIDHAMHQGQFDIDVSGPVNIHDWDPRSIPEPTVIAYTSAGDNKTRQTGAYAMGRFHVSDSLTLITGARTSWWDQRTATDHYKPDRQLTPYGGVIWDFHPHWSGYVSYADVFKPQTQRTYSGEVLDPMDGEAYEAGIKATTPGEALTVSAAVFRIDQSDRAQEDPEHPGAGNDTYYIHGGEVRSEGAELEVNGRLTRHWQLYAGYTYTDSEYRKDADNQGEDFSSITPRHLFKLWSHYDLPWHDRRLSVGGGIQAQSDISKTSGAVTQRQGGYVLVNLRAGYRLNRQWRIALNVNNVFDRHYYQELFSPAWSNRYGEPRNVTISLRGQFR